MSEELTLKDSIFRIGRVISVEGRSVKIKVDTTKNSSHLMYKGELLKNISVGGYIKITKGFTSIIGKVEGEFTNEDKQVAVKEYVSDKFRVNRVLNVSLLGFFGNKGFERGIKELPLIDNECFLLDKKEFSNVHNFIRKDDEPITIGTLALEKGQSINVGIDAIFASHIGIFGNTGSGKSYTLAKLYRELFLKYEGSQTFTSNGRFLLIDFNGEYAGDECIVPGKTVYNLTTKLQLEDIAEEEKFPISSNDLIDIELISILASATDKTQKPFLSRAIDFYRKLNNSDDPINFFRNTVKRRVKDVLSMSDKGKAFMLKDYLINIFGTDENRLTERFTTEFEWHSTFDYFMLRNVQINHQLTLVEIEASVFYNEVDNYQFPENVLDRFIDFLYLQIIFDLYSDKAQNDHIAPAIQKLKSKKNDIGKVLRTEGNGENIFQGSNFVVVNLNDVNLDMRKALPLLFSKKIYDEQKKLHRQDSRKFLNIIVDEAHNILSTDSHRESESWKDYRLETFEEIIKEGRKFGVFLTIASQRPHDISPTIVSQLHNYFLHRLINNHDILAVERTISYLDKVSVEYLSILPTGTCIMAGLAAQVPVVIEIGKIDPKINEPDNKTISLVKIWSNEEEEH